MAANVAANTTLSFVLRAAQLALAIIVMGTGGYGTESLSTLCRGIVEADFSV